MLSVLTSKSQVGVYAGLHTQAEPEQSAVVHVVWSVEVLSEQDAATWVAVPVHPAVAVPVHDAGTTVAVPVHDAAVHCASGPASSWQVSHVTAAAAVHDSATPAS